MAGRVCFFHTSARAIQEPLNDVYSLRLQVPHTNQKDGRLFSQSDPFVTESPFGLLSMVMHNEQQQQNDTDTIDRQK